MSFNDLNQYTPGHKVWDHVGNILPDIELSEGERPAVEFKPAAWLPVQFRDKYYEEYYTIMPGKAVALDPDGCVMPAQYGLTSASVVYTQNDVDAGVIDVSTGLAVASVKTVALANLDGVRESGWTAATAGVTKTSGFMGRYGAPGNFVDGTRKPAIGVAPYGAFQWAGGDGSNPANLRKHNHMLQHQVAVLCDYVLKLPYVPAVASAEGVDKTATASALVIGTANVHNRTYTIAEASGRYDSTNGTVPVAADDTVVAIALAKIPVAKNTPKTEIALASDNASDDLSDILVNERSAISAVTAAGDYFVDYEAGVIFIYSSDGATLPTSLSGAAGTVSITYFNYEDSAAAGTLSKFASVCGAALQPGALLVTGANSNLIEWGGTELQDEVIGQVLAIVDDYNEGLGKVRTAFNPAIDTDSSGSMASATAGSASANLGQLDQMPGSATGGYTDLTHYAGAVKFAIVNLIGR
jgi:hypothetical protein